LKENTKIAIIGLGGVAQLVHLPILSKINSVDIVAVSEINKTRLKTVAEKFSIKNKYTDFTKMLSEIEFDAAIISTPTNTHKDIAVECLKHGKHLLIEKPIALNYEETKIIDDTAKKI
jgi:predicted dehydrogenase